MNAPTQEMVNDDVELIYKYTSYLQFDLTEICWAKLHVFASFVDYEVNNSCSKAYSNSENQFKLFVDVVGYDSAVWNGE